MNRKLLILGCSQAKRKDEGLLPALARYDGPMYQSLRKFLRHNQWPPSVSIAVLSAKHGLFGILKGIEDYDARMDPSAATSIAPKCLRTLEKWAGYHDTFHLSVGKDYLPAVQPAIQKLKVSTVVYSGPIGEKRSQVTSFLNGTSPGRRVKVEIEGGTGRTRYFLPDWDDLLDSTFDFERDSFSAPFQIRSASQKHCCVLMRPKQICDGVLVSLAQQGTTKGPLRRLRGTEAGALSPIPLRKHFGLSPAQCLFGDCGAFSYVNEAHPTIPVEQAVALYDLYGFDFGASVDHIPVESIRRDGKRRALSNGERQERVAITRENAERFIETVWKRRAGFNPVGTIQALGPQQYAQFVREYYDLGYRHIAIGGLVPLQDGEIESIVRAVSNAAADLKERPWIHLFGVFRPKLQALFHGVGIDSFDSATYFRKAWLRSDQNYLSTDGRWFAALRVPMTKDGRTRMRMTGRGADLARIEREEREVLQLLCKYDREEVGLSEVLDALVHYDQRLDRSSERRSMRRKYRETLSERPWRRCGCPFCKEIGIHVLIFRGANRNKRRGAHNTLMLYRQVQKANGKRGRVIA